MLPHEFSWTKILCFIGVGVFFIAAFACLGKGVGLMVDGEGFYGLMTVIGGILCAVAGVATYKYYNWWQDKQSKSK